MSALGRANPLRISHVVQGLDVGGLEKLVIELVRRTDPRLADAEIVCTDALGRLGDGCRSEIEVSAILARPGLDWRAVLRLAGHFRRRQTEIIHSHNQRAHALSVLARALARVPVLINTRHGLYGPPTLRAVFRRRGMAVWSDAILSVSEVVRDEAIRVDRIPARKVRTILNGTELSVSRLGRSEARRRLAIPDDAFAIGAVGRLSREKDHATLLEAYARARPEVPRLAAAILGDGPLAEELAAAAATLGCDGMRFGGYQPDAVALLDAFDVFVQPSLTEGTPLSLIEAMAAGLPIIATTAGGNPEVVGEAGLLVPAGDAGALACAIASLARDPARRERLAAAARRRAEERFSIAAMVGAYEALYVELARAKGLGA